MKKLNLFLCIFCLSFLIASCAKSSITELRKEAKYHYTFYSDLSLENTYNQAMKKYNECGVPISNNFIDNQSGDAAATYNNNIRDNGWFAHADFKKIDLNKTQVDVYSIFDMGSLSKFINVTKYAAEQKKGCPND